MQFPPRALARHDTETIATMTAVRAMAAESGREHKVWKSRGRYRWYAVEAVIDPNDLYPSAIIGEAQGRALTYREAERAARMAFDPTAFIYSAKRADTLSRMNRPRRFLVLALDRGSFLAFLLAAFAVGCMFVCLFTGRGIDMLVSLFGCAVSLMLGFRLESWAEWLVDDTERALGHS